MPVPPPPNAKKVFSSGLLAIYEWPQVLFDGTTVTFDCCVRPDSAAIIPFLDEKTVLLAYQEQPLRGGFYDVPGGRVDGGESAMEAAKRELTEETGYQAKRWELIKQIPHTGIVRFEANVFLAADLAHDASQRHEDAGEKILLKPMPWEEVIQLCLRGELRRPEVALLLLAMEYEPEQRRRLHEFLSAGA